MEVIRSGKIERVGVDTWAKGRLAVRESKGWISPKSGKGSPKSKGGTTNYQTFVRSGVDSPQRDKSMFSRSNHDG